MKSLIKILNLFYPTIVGIAGAYLVLIKPTDEFEVWAIGGILILLMFIGRLLRIVGNEKDLESRLHVLRRYHGGDGTVTRQEVMKALSKE